MPSLTCLRPLAAAALLLAAPVFGQIGIRLGSLHGLGTMVPDQQATVLALARRVDELTGGPATIEDTAWHLLAFSANGSCPRSGPYMEQVEKLVTWLRACQDPAGHFAPCNIRAPRREQLLGAFALLSAHIEGNYVLIRRQSIRSVQVAAEAFERPAAAPATAEEGLLLAMITERMRSLQKGEPALQDRVEELAKQALGRVTIGRSRVGDAALHLGRLLLGQVSPPELTIAQCVPANLSADPWHTFVGAYAIKHLDHETRRGQWPAVLRLMAERGKDDLWPAAATDDAHRHLRAAMFATAVGLIYVPPPENR